MPDYLRDLTDGQLRALEAELTERAEEFDSRVRTQVADELRRRKLPPGRELRRAGVCPTCGRW